MRTWIFLVCFDSKAIILSEEVQDDKTLKIPRQLMGRSERGYSWQDGLLTHNN